MKLVLFIQKTYSQFTHWKNKKKALAAIKKSNFFNEEFYRNSYNISPKIDAAEHFLTKGWLCDYKPSESYNQQKFNSLYRMPAERGSNPLVAHNRYNRAFPKTIIFPSECINLKKNFEVNSQPIFKRIAIFSSFNKEGVITDDVIYYLKGLHQIVDNIIFIADNPIIETEVEKLKDLVCYCQFYRHNEYDFGSYKIGYNYASDSGLLSKTEEIILCNDSCFGPIYPFKETFEYTKDIKCDFWGYTSSNILDYHIQSYFLVFRKNIIESNILKTFLSYVKKQDSVDEVIFFYETKLTPFLQFHGYRSYALFEQHGLVRKDDDYFDITSPLEHLGKTRIPLIKKKALQINGEYKVSRRTVKKLKKTLQTINPDLLFL